MLKPFLILPGLLAAAVFASPLQAPQAAAPAAEFKVPADAAGQANPVKSNPESLARGKKFTATNAPCAMETMGAARANWPRI